MDICTEEPKRLVSTCVTATSREASYSGQPWSPRIKKHPGPWVLPGAADATLDEPGTWSRGACDEDHHEFDLNSVVLRVRHRPSSTPRDFVSLPGFTGAG